jgi:hypothetical protein
MDINMECEFCKKTFSTKSNLSAHQKSAKFCLELQGDNADESKFTCEYCQKVLTQQKSLDIHIISCKEKKKKIESSKEAEINLTIKKLENEIIKLKRLEKEKLKEKDNYYQETLKEKDNYYQETLKEKDNYYQEKLQEKNECITKLEARLDKFENAVSTIATSLELNKKTDSKNSENIQHINSIPLGEQMSSIVIEEVEEDEIKYTNITLNNVVISSRPLYHYVNSTQLCQAGGKKFNDWFRLDTTNELIKELSSEAGIPVSLLVESNRGRTSKFIQGSWIHPDLSIQLAQWISPKFAIQISQWVRTLFNQGSLEIDISILREKEHNMRIKDHRIKQLENVCLSKQRRIEYPEKNVIYMLTTEDHLKRRTYIIGKAKNLTNRLSTYNKTSNHTVVYYRECCNEDDMDTAETMVLSKLRPYREQANRDRFILPEDKDESFFTNTIDNCIQFL